MRAAAGIVAGIGVLGVAATASPSFAGTEFLAYEGRNAIHEGQGGNKKVVEGVEFWISGDPPHRFQVIGSISDRRHETGLFGMVRMAGMETDIARAAKVAGGDAVILSDQSEEFLGAASVSNTNVSGGVNGSEFHANAFSSSFARAVKNHLASYVVVKYLPDVPSASLSTLAHPLPTPPSRQ
jgi:hypothetical protein